MHVFNYYFLVRVASVTVKINEVLSCTKWHAWNMKYKKRVQVLACQPISTHNCAVKKKLKIKHHQETKNGYLAPILEKDWTFLATYHGDHLSQTPFS